MKNLGFLCPCSTYTIIVFIYISILMCSNVVVHAEGFDSDSLLQLPRSGSPRTRPRARRIFSVGDFGAKGDGHHNDTKSFENAWKIACSFPVRTRILIPAGYTYLVHPVELGGPCRSKITLMISGTIIAPKNPDVWDGLNPRKWLYFHEVNHLHVAGGGTINGMGQKWWARSCKRKKTNPCRHAPTVRPAFLLENKNKIKYGHRVYFLLDKRI